MYGKKTGATPDGRAKGLLSLRVPTRCGRDKNGAIASWVLWQTRYRDAQDGISNTFYRTKITRSGSGEPRIEKLITMMDGYFTEGAPPPECNVLNREMLEDAMEHPEKYPQLTIRVSGYAVNFISQAVNIN